MEDKTFTQEEVNKIVSKRLTEEREKMQKEQDATLAEREQAIKAREMRMSAIEKLQEKGLPTSLADALNCSDEKALESGIEILSNTYGQASTGTNTHVEQPYSPRGGGAPLKDDPIRRAMGL